MDPVKYLQMKMDALRAVRSSGLALQKHPAMQDDVDVVRAAVLQNGYALRYAGPGMKGYKPIVLLAVKQNGLALEYAHPALQNDRPVVIAAVESSFGFAVQHASEDILVDAEVGTAIKRSLPRR